MQRFIPKAHDPAFRKALVANLKSHPEWDPDPLPREVQAEGTARAEATAQDAGARRPSN